MESYQQWPIEDPRLRVERQRGGIPERALVAIRWVGSFLAMLIIAWFVYTLLRPDDEVVDNEESGEKENESEET